jgi:hypothetical protein
MKKLIIVIIIMAIGGGAYYWWMQSQGGGTVRDPQAIKIEGTRKERKTFIKENNARVGATLKTCATGVYSYFIDSKVYPDNLAQLTTPVAYLTEIPRDVYTQENNIQYRKIGKNEFVLWSIGADGRDDNGQVEYNANKGLESKGDLVWHHDIR